MSDRGGHADFMREIEPFLDHAVRQCGGVADLTERSRAVPGTVTFVAGYVCGMIAYQRYVRAWSDRSGTASIADTGLTQDEIRRVHDVVRLAIGG